MENGARKRDILLDDIARDLELSKSTVSRAISGKGRVSEKTRERVLRYIEQHSYRPNIIAQSLASSRSFNIGVVLPSDYFFSESPFFQNVLAGIVEATEEVNYDAIVISCSENDWASLRRIIQNSKVDGVIITRAVDDDLSVDYLKSINLPFVLIGSVSDPEIAQIDTNQVVACRALMRRLTNDGIKRPALLYGNPKHAVNHSRLSGFQLGLSDAGILEADCQVFSGISNIQDILMAVNILLDSETDCIVCGDDYIASHIKMLLNSLNFEVQNKIRIASFFNSVLLENFNPPILAVNIDANALGRAAAHKLLSGLIESYSPSSAEGDIQDAWAIIGDVK